VSLPLATWRGSFSALIDVSFFTTIIHVVVFAITEKLNDGACWSWKYCTVAAYALLWASGVGFVDGVFLDAGGSSVALLPCGSSTMSSSPPAGTSSYSSLLLASVMSLSADDFFS
jgi:hypothetical protein